ncbi:hypothetical protein BKA62DRAFT_684832 [Auriculariales sp. MPI-PUGE-AT-0066]|nr:hypothetical protein BKA62DRAFT_684832 [Auriculariales sp. MPI-PUGE-AT-0066]
MRNPMPRAHDSPKQPTSPKVTQHKRQTSQPSVALTHNLDFANNHYITHYRLLKSGVRARGKALIADITHDHQIATLLQDARCEHNEIWVKDMLGDEFVVQFQVKDPNAQHTLLQRFVQGGTFVMYNPVKRTLAGGKTGIVVADKDLSSVTFLFGSVKSLMKLNEEMNTGQSLQCQQRNCTSPGSLTCELCKWNMYCTQDCVDANWRFMHEVQCTSFKTLRELNKNYNADPA